MRNLDAMMFSRWIVAGAALLTPLVVGCSSNTDTVPESGAATTPPDAGQEQQQSYASEVPSAPDRTEAEQLPGRQAPEERLSDADLVKEAIGSASGEDATFNEDTANVTERPKSIFRSIGRALQKGVTDAAGVTSNDSSDEPLDPTPEDSR